MSKKYITVLSIAGSDSCGGAGIQADIKTCDAMGVYAMTAVTAITAQNTTGVNGFEAASQEILRTQLAAIADDCMPDAVKIGMLPTAKSVRIVADWIDLHAFDKVVVDPVMVATSGDALTQADTRRSLMEYLFPLATIITPNIPEASILAEIQIDSEAMTIEAGEKLTGVTHNVLIKGGHGDRDVITDYLFEGHRPPRPLAHKRIPTWNTHGTGCSLSTAIACQLAMGFKLSASVERAIDWVQTAIQAGKDFTLGRGHGPINHNFNNALYK